MTPLVADAFLMPATTTVSPPRERRCLRDPQVFHHSCMSSVPLRWKSNSAGAQQLLTWASGSWAALHLKGMFPEGAQQEDFAPPPLEDSFFCPKCVIKLFLCCLLHLHLRVFSFRRFIYIEFIELIYAILSVGLHRQAAVASSLTETALQYTVLFTLHLHMPPYAAISLMKPFSCNSSPLRSSGVGPCHSAIERTLLRWVIGREPHLLRFQ